MARARKPKAFPLEQVQPGDVFAAPLPDGRWCACRVLRVDADPLSALVAASSWIGATLPKLTEPRLKAILRPTHHGSGRAPCVYWVMDPVPTTFVHLGNLPPTAAEASTGCGTFSGWDLAAVDVFQQWRWDHERAALLAEEAEESHREEEERQRQEEAEEVRRHTYQPPPKQTLHELRQRPFKSWEGYLDATDLRAARKAIRATIDALLALGPEAPEPLQLNVLRWCTERFYEFDDDNGWVGTLEREDVCAFLDEVAAAVGLADYSDALPWHGGW